MLYVVYNWSVDSVISWLNDHVELSQYTPNFRSSAIEGRALPRYSAFFVKEYFPVPSSGGNQCKNRHAPIWHFG